jgi:flagellar FliL protein
MSDEAPPVEEKPKKPIVKIILAVVALIVLVVAVMLGTLFMTGFFAAKPVESADEMLAGDEGGHGAPKADAGHGAPKADAGHGAPKADAGHGAPKADAKSAPAGKKSPEVAKFEYTYQQLEREFLVNLAGSKKVMSVQIAIMTHYDERVFANAKKHEFALRSVVMDVMRLTTEADLVKPDFRKELAVRIRDAMNSMVEKYEGFGGIEEVHFTSFIVQ